MAILFPGVQVRELDFSDYAPRLATTVLGLVGVAHKGPMHTPTLVTTVAELISTFGPPPSLSGAQDEKQIVKITGASGGTFTLTLDGQTTSTITYNATTAQVQNAVEALSNVGVGNAAVSGQTGGPWTIAFIGDMGSRPVNEMTIDPSLLTGPGAVTATVETTQQGRSQPGDYAMHAAMFFLRQGRQLYFTRTSQYVTGGGWAATTASSYPADVTPGSMRWSTGRNEVQAISMSGALNAGTCTFTITFSGTAANPLSTPETTGPIAYNATNTDVKNALVALASIDSDEVSVTGGPGPGTAWVIEFKGARYGNQNMRPLTTTDTSGGGSTLATSVASTTEGRQTRALIASARTPGDWGNDLSVRFTKIDGAVNEKQSVTIAGSPVGGTFTLTFNGYTTNPIAYNASWGTVQAALELLTSVGAGNVSVTGVTGGPYLVEFTNDLGHTDVPLMTANGAGLTPGTATPSVSVTVALGGVPKSHNLYLVEVLGPIDDSGATIDVIESFDRVMLLNDPALLSQYDAHFLGTVINSGIRNGPIKSSFVEFDLTTFPTSATDIVAEIAASGDTDGVIFSLDGGFSALNTWAGTSGDGSAAYIGTENDAAYNVTGLQVYRNPQAIDVNLLAIPGITDDAVLTELEDVCASRQDAMCVIDTPEGLTPNDAIAWHNKTGSYAMTGHKPNTSYAALYWPWVMTYDPYNREDVTLPPSCFVPGQYAYSDQQSAPWYAPAGLQRGQIRDGLALESATPSPGMLESLYSGGNCINPIVDFSQTGIHIFGQRTTQRRASKLDRVSVRRLLIHTEKIIATTVKYLVFEPNDKQTWRQFVALVEPVLQNVKAGRGLYDFKVICDETTNPPEQVDRSEMRGVLMLKPTATAEYITIDFTLLSTGAEFSIPQNV